MTRRQLARTIALGLACMGGGLLGSAAFAAEVAGVVRATEVRIAPEVGGQLAAIKIQKGTRVHPGDIVAELSAQELTAAVGQARAAHNAAIASRNHVYAGVRAEEIAVLAAEIGKAKARLAYAKVQLTRTAYLTQSSVASLQTLDQMTHDMASANADLTEAAANHAAAVAGPTSEERAIADAQVQATGAALAVLERRLDKTILRAPVEGVVSVIVAEIGEAVSVGQPVLVIERPDRQWLSFNVREDRLQDVGVGARVAVRLAGATAPIPALVTELCPLGTFATWQAERAVGDHDLSTLRLRLEPEIDAAALEPGMTVWLEPRRATRSPMNRDK